MSDYISRADAMAEFREWVKRANENGETPTWNDAVSLIGSLPSAEAVPQSEQYKKGFEDAKRAFLVEYARESENMRKRNAQIEVMLNAQRAISAEAVQGEWVEIEDYNGDYHYQCSVCKDEFYLAYGTPKENGYAYCPSCGARMYREDGEV